jgi:hypothetical protein
MDIHKPKPWHGLREFLKEYLIIVADVLTALEAEQTAEWLHHREQIERTREALHAEMREMLGVVQATQPEDRCKLVQLKELEAWARSGPKPQGKAMTVPTGLENYIIQSVSCNVSG